MRWDQTEVTNIVSCEMPNIGIGIVIIIVIVMVIVTVIVIVIVGIPTLCREMANIDIGIAIIIAVIRCFLFRLFPFTIWRSLLHPMSCRLFLEEHLS